MGKVLVTAYVDEKMRNDLRKRGVNISCLIRAAMKTKLDKLVAGKHFPCENAPFACPLMAGDGSGNGKKYPERERQMPGI